MRFNREQFFLNHRRIRQVMDYLDAHLEDDSMTLDTLADVACLSRFHFERLYATKVQETPMATVRRLRLQRASQVLRQVNPPSITQLAVQAGYGSVAAFSRAYCRAYGHAPSQARDWIPEPVAEPSLEVIELLPVPVVYLPFSGQVTDLLDVGGELSWAVARSGAKRWRHWTVFPDGCADILHATPTWIRAQLCVPTATLPLNVSGVARGCLPAGIYARFAFVGQQPKDIRYLITRVAEETTWRVSDGPVLHHSPNVHNFTPVSERIVHFYLPVVPCEIHSR